MAQMGIHVTTFTFVHEKVDLNNFLLWQVFSPYGQLENLVKILMH